MEEDKPLKGKFTAVVLGIIFNPAEKKILIARRENDPNLPNLEWCFPGGKLEPGDEIDKTLKNHMKKKTGYKIKNLGTIFSDICSGKKNLIEIYFLTEVFTGEEIPGDGVVELKWVNPDEIESYFKMEFNTRLKEYLMNLM